jgi:hypothetical protein
MDLKQLLGGKHLITLAESSEAEMPENRVARLALYRSGGPRTSLINFSSGIKQALICGGGLMNFPSFLIPIFVKDSAHWVLNY